MWKGALVVLIAAALASAQDTGTLCANAIACGMNMSEMIQAWQTLQGCQRRLGRAERDALYRCVRGGVGPGLASKVDCTYQRISSG